MSAEHIYSAKEILENLRAGLDEAPTLAIQIESLRQLTQEETAELLYLMIQSWGETMLREIKRVERYVEKCQVQQLPQAFH